MGSKHYLGMIVLLIAAYLLGVTYPAWGTSAIAKVQSIA